jgi:hypothetical protein
VITLSSALAEANEQAFQGGTEPVSALDAAALRKIVAEMIDQALLEQEMSRSAMAMEHSDHDLDVFRKRFTTAASYNDALQRYHVTEKGLISRAARQRAMMEFIDGRLRSQATVSREMIDDYYRATLLPQLASQGSAAPPLEQVSGQIEQVLLQREINRLLDEWLKDLRSRAEIKLIE